MLDRFINADAGQRLGIYLNDHRAGASAGRALTQRVADSNPDNDIGAYLTTTFLPELEEDRQYLDALCDRLSVAANPAKNVAARAAEFAGRLKLNGSLIEYSPLSRIVELEGLIAAVNTKMQLWETLDNLDHEEIGDVTDLVDRAQAQVTKLESLHRSFVDEAFAD